MEAEKAAGGGSWNSAAELKWGQGCPVGQEVGEVKLERGVVYVQGSTGNGRRDGRGRRRSAVEGIHAPLMIGIHWE